MKKIWYLLLIVLTMFFTFLGVYLIDNPPSKSSSNTVYPYVLSVNPKVISKGESVEVLLKSLLGKIDVNNLTISFIDPMGNITSYSTNNSNSNMWKIIKKNNYQEGNNTVLLLSKLKNQILNKQNFMVVFNPFVSS